MPRPADRRWRTPGRTVASLAVDTALEGKAYPTTSFEVDAAHVGTVRIRRRSDGAGRAADFLTAAEFGVFDPIVSDPELGLDFSRVVHGDQEYEWHRPVVVGETLDGPARGSPPSANEEATASSRSRPTLCDADGEPVATTRATMIERAAE